MRVPRYLAGPAVALVALAAVAIAFGSGQSAAEATRRLNEALDRTETMTSRLELRAVSEMAGSRALGGGYTQTVHGVGELVPPDRLHVTLDGSGPVDELVIVGSRTWVDAGSGLRLASGVPLGPLSRPRAPLDFIRGPGDVRFSWFGLSRGTPTYRVRLELDGFELQARVRSDQPVDPDATGAIEVEIGLFDGLVHRQTVEIVEPADPFSGTGVDRVRTTYTVEYWDHGSPLAVREPD